MWSDDTFVRYVGGEIQSRSGVWKSIQKMTGGWALMGYGYWAIEDRQTAKYLGEVGFQEALRALTPSYVGIPEAGWAIAPAAWGQGIATEALSAAVSWADTRFGDLRTYCLIDIPNQASIRVAEKNGFKLAREIDYLGQPNVIMERNKN